MTSRSKICWIWRTGFYIYGWTIVGTIALWWVIFKQKKGSGTICLGLIYCSMGSSQPPTHDTVPLKWQCHEIFDPCFFSSNNSPQGPDSQTESLLHMASYSPRKIYAEIVKIGSHSLNETAGSKFFCQSSPLILTFSSNYRYVMFRYVFVFAIVFL
jgi:hypothetical protein